MRYNCWRELKPASGANFAGKRARARGLADWCNGGPDGGRNARAPELEGVMTLAAPHANRRGFIGGLMPGSSWGRMRPPWAACGAKSKPNHGI